MYIAFLNTSIPVPTQDQALQQVLMLKKELAEMRANQALAEDTSLSSGVDREVSRARGMLGTVNAEADMERSAHRETLDALDASETSVRLDVYTCSKVYTMNRRIIWDSITSPKSGFCCSELRLQVKMMIKFAQNLRKKQQKCNICWRYLFSSKL